MASGKLLIESIPGAGKMLDCLLGSEFSGITNEGKRIMGMVMDKVRLITIRCCLIIVIVLTSLTRYFNNTCNDKKINEIILQILTF